MIAPKGGMREQAKSGSGRAAGNRATGFLLLLRVPTALTFLAALPFLLHAQDSPCMRQTIVANVTDWSGLPVLGLEASNFRGKFRGRPVKIHSATRASEPQRVVIVLDRSGSMNEEGTWNSVREIVVDAVCSLGRSHWVGYISFSEVVDHRVPLTRQSQEILRTIDEAQNATAPLSMPKGKTALFDSLGTALKMLEPTQPGDSIFVLTDGGDNVSRTKPYALERDLARAGVRLFVFATPRSTILRWASPRGEIESLRALEQIALASGGKALSPAMHHISDKGYWRSEKQRRALFYSLKCLYREVAEYYEIDVELGLPVDKPREWQLEALDTDGKKMKNVDCIYQRVLMPCAAPSIGGERAHRLPTAQP